MINKTNVGHNNLTPSNPAPSPTEKAKGQDGGEGGGRRKKEAEEKSRSTAAQILEVLCGPIRVAAPTVIMDSPSRRVSFVNTHT